MYDYFIKKVIPILNLFLLWNNIVLDEFSLFSRTGVFNDGPKTQEEIAKIFNLTRMRVCQIEQKAKNKMKKRIGEEWRN